MIEDSAKLGVRQINHSPFVAFLGLRVVDIDLERGEITMVTDMRPEFERSPNSNQWHGGPIAAIIDTVGDYALVMSLHRAPPTMNFRVDYLRPAIETSLRATARVRRSAESPAWSMSMFSMRSKDSWLSAARPIQRDLPRSSALSGDHE